MFLSTRARYGLRAVFYIALNYNNSVSLSQIAEGEGISLNYLEQLFLLLRKGNIVKSIRGAKGGYTLSKAPGEITVKDIILSLEGPMIASNCVEETDCELKNNCSTRVVWKKLTDALNDAMEKITLEDMIKDEQELNNQILNYKIEKTKC